MSYTTKCAKCGKDFDVDTRAGYHSPVICVACSNKRKRATPARSLTVLAAEANSIALEGGSKTIDWSLEECLMIMHKDTLVLLDWFGDSDVTNDEIESQMVDVLLDVFRSTTRCGLDIEAKVIERLADARAELEGD